MEGGSGEVRDARTWSGDLLELLALARRALKDKGESLPPSWPEEALQEIRSGRYLGLVLVEGTDPRGILVLSPRNHRAFGHVHLLEGTDPSRHGRRLLESLPSRLPSTVRRADLTVTVPPPGREEDCWMGLPQPPWGLLRRRELRRSLSPEDPPDPRELPLGFRFVPVNRVALPALGALDFAAFQNGPDAGMVAETPADSERLLGGLLGNDLGRFLPEASPAVEGRPRSSEGGAGPLAGFVLCVEQTSQRALVADLAVGPEFRRQGLGEALLRRSLRALVALGYREATLWVTDTNEPARRLYEKLGFQTSRTGLVLHWRRPEPDGP
jgi:ribosomal protein S18 acetylase RimI-like enzyme